MIIVREKEISADKQTRAEYEARTRELNRFYAAKASSYREGIDEGEKIGIEKGKSEGAREKAIETARKMLAKGLDLKDISEFSGLSVEEIRHIK